MLLDYESHKNLHDYTKTLNHFYTEQKSLWQIENSWDGFKWINANDENNSVISFIRTGNAKSDYLICLCNFTPVKRENYVIGVPSGGEYTIIFSSDDEKFGGMSKTGVSLKAKKQSADDFKYSLEIDLPPLTTLFIKKVKAQKHSEETAKAREKAASLKEKEAKAKEKEKAAKPKAEKKTDKKTKTKDKK